MARRSLTATGLRLTLSITLLSIAIIASVTIHFLNEGLKTFATEVSHTSADARASEDTIQTLKKIEQELDANREVIERARSIVADSQSYQYQDQIITDLNDYANRAGIGITNIDFSTAEVAPGTPGAAPVAPAGVKTTSVSITLKNPVDYNSLLRFIKSIEQNLTKMQISRVGLAKDTGNNVSSEALAIEVYIR
jgi:TolA-binding protein